MPAQKKARRERKRSRSKRGKGDSQEGKKLRWSPAWGHRRHRPCLLDRVVAWSRPRHDDPGMPMAKVRCENNITLWERWNGGLYHKAVTDCSMVVVREDIKALVPQNTMSVPDIAYKARRQVRDSTWIDPASTLTPVAAYHTSLQDTS